MKHTQIHILLITFFSFFALSLTSCRTSQIKEHEKETVNHQEQTEINSSFHSETEEIEYNPDGTVKKKTTTTTDTNSNINTNSNTQTKTDTTVTTEEQKNIWFVIWSWIGKYIMPIVRWLLLIAAIMVVIKFRAWRYFGKLIIWIKGKAKR